MDCSPPGSSIHGILQARIPERVAISFSRGSSWPRDRTRLSYSSCIGRWVLYVTWEAHPRDEGVLILPSEPFWTLPTQHFLARTGGFLLLGEIGNSLLGGMWGSGLRAGIRYPQRGKQLSLTSRDLLRDGPRNKLQVRENLKLRSPSHLIHFDSYKIVHVWVSMTCLAIPLLFEFFVLFCFAFFCHTNRGAWDLSSPPVIETGKQWKRWVLTTRLPGNLQGLL